MAADPRVLRFGFHLCCALLLANTSRAAETKRAVKNDDADARQPWYFSLLPKPFERDPVLPLTVVTEVTEAGKKRPLVSAQAPAYFEFHALGYRSMGDAMKETPLPAPEIESLLERSLAAGGFLRGSAEHPPTLVIVYFWGSHNHFDESNDAVPYDQLVRNYLDRAALVGGTKFAADLAKAYRETEVLLAASPVPTANTVPEYDGLGLGVASAMAQMNRMSNPLQSFALQKPRNRQLMDLAAQDLYYVVASAYDRGSVAADQRQLLWRTRLTVAADGMAQRQSLPVLIAAAAPFFGHETPEPEILRKRSLRRGNVEIGTPTVVPPRP
jgi:hypothetical protein